MSSNSKCNTTGPDGLRCCHVVGAAFKEAGRFINEVLDQKSFYDSPVKIATRMIGDAKRLGYLQDLEHVGALALANLAQLAVSTKNKALGSAIIERLAVMPTEKKPLRAADVSKAVFDEEWQKVQEAFNIAENRLQGWKGEGV